MSLDTIRMSVPHVVRGRVSEPTPEHFTEYKDFATPKIDLDALVCPRTSPARAGCAAGGDHRLPVETGQRLALDDNPYMQQCSNGASVTHLLRAS